MTILGIMVINIATIGSNSRRRRRRKFASLGLKYS